MNNIWINNNIIFHDHQTTFRIHQEQQDTLHRSSWLAQHVGGPASLVYSTLAAAAQSLTKTSTKYNNNKLRSQNERGAAADSQKGK